MKDSIVAYVTALIDTHSRICENTKKINPYVARYDEIFKDELSDLLDFIEDIPEEKASKDTEGLKKTTDWLEILELVRYERNILKTRVEELARQLNEKSDLEQYAGFIKAIRAYHEANRTIVCKYGNVYSHTHTYKATGNGLLDENGKAIAACEILKGKWSIKGEEE